MLSLRVCHLLALGLCLVLITKYMQFMRASVCSLDRLLTRRFFDVDGLTSEIRARVEGPGYLGRALYLWLCHRLRRAAGLDSGVD